MEDFNGCHIWFVVDLSAISLKFYFKYLGRTPTEILVQDMLWKPVPKMCYLTVDRHDDDLNIMNFIHFPNMNSNFTLVEVYLTVQLITIEILIY